MAAVMTMTMMPLAMSVQHTSNPMTMTPAMSSSVAPMSATAPVCVTYRMPNGVADDMSTAQALPMSCTSVGGRGKSQKAYGGDE